MNKVVRILVSFIFIAFYFFILSFVVFDLSMPVEPLVAYAVKYVMFIFPYPDIPYFLNTIHFFLELYFVIAVYTPITINYIRFSWRITEDGAYLGLILKVLLIRSIFTSFFLIFITLPTILLSLKFL